MNCLLLLSRHFLDVFTIVQLTLHEFSIITELVLARYFTNVDPTLNELSIIVELALPRRFTDVELTLMSCLSSLD